MRAAQAGAGRLIYLDHHAATPLDPRVREVMARAHDVAWANPSSVHKAGRQSRAFLERAREQVARSIGAQPADLVFTSGGTEACHLALFGSVSDARRATPRHIVTTSIEHPAVSMPLASLEARGVARVTRLGIPGGLAPSVESFAASLADDTALVAIQWVNHETGTVLPVAEYAAVCRARGVRCFIDATQALGKLPIDVETLGADLVALAAHKISGPSGAGALWIRRGVEIEPQALGGSQERGRRAGTQDVVALVGFGTACEFVPERLAAQPNIARLRDRLEEALLGLGGIRNADAGPRVPTVTNLSFRSWRGEAIVAALDLEGVAVSSGAACSSGKSEPSPVLLAMHPDEPWRAGSALRSSFGPESKESDVEFAIAAVRTALARPPA